MTAVHLYLPMSAACCSRSPVAAESQRFEVGGKPAMAFEVPIDRLKPERLMCYRDELNSHITREALRLQPSIRLQLDAQVSKVDLDRQQLTLSQGGKPAEVRCCSLCPACCLAVHVCGCQAAQAVWM